MKMGIKKGHHIFSNNPDIDFIYLGSAHMSIQTSLKSLAELLLTMWVIFEGNHALSNRNIILQFDQSSEPCKAEDKITTSQTIKEIKGFIPFAFHPVKI